MFLISTAIIDLVSGTGSTAFLPASSSPILNVDASFFTARHVAFTGSTVTSAVVVADQQNNVLFDRCYFGGNTPASAQGGGLAVRSNSIALSTSCTFASNSATDGGGLAIEYSTVSVASSLFTQNTVSGHGAAI